MSQDELQDIINGCKRGDRISQKALYRHFYNYGMNVCNRYSKSVVEAEEILNDAFLRVFTKIDLYDPARSFPGWIHTIFVHSSINYLKKYHTRLLMHCPIEVMEANAPILDENIISQLSAGELVNLIQHLPLSYRTVFNLAVIEGYSHVEIGVMLNITDGTSRSNLLMARKKLQIMIYQHNLIRI
jgi:RNA polymerase sigma-70 factor, ECF subfamily